MDSSERHSSSMLAELQRHKLRIGLIHPDLGIGKRRSAANSSGSPLQAQMKGQMTRL